MKRAYLSLFIAAALALSACSDNSAKTAPPAEHPTASAQNTNLPTYVVGSELGYMPFEFIGDKGQAVGFEMEVLEEIAKVSGFQLQFINSPRNAIASTLNDGSRQIWASALSINPKRLEQMDMSEPFMDFEAAIAIADTPENANVQTLQDLSDKKIAFNKGGSSNAETVEKLKGEAVPADTFFLALRSMRLGKADAIVGDVRVFQYYKTHENDKIRIISMGQGAKPLGFAVKKGNAELLTKLNSGLAKIKGDGTLDKLVTKWFGENQVASQPAK
ncbi:transporter substrate-binding domain-containing protein [Kingella negevensis]|uniref:transporter substrate-binding domain-containing protein n=1 Tax=Kingella negevensis TaxID=1522312 RepID=UPI00050A29FD|nr:transporter substrate-binding domain-containing protein [Kingella negevensis]MDK4688464.1 transporter substrate-binding domain-containing protein [Kingella negevensis]WII90280.1 transporter substrate-binding domain-containing protein [Kingella negevensis]